MPSLENKKKAQKNKILYIFAATFFITLVTLIYLATALTPNIDVDVEPDSTSEIAEKQGSVDDRLRQIQQEELFSGQSRLNRDESSSEIFDRLRKMRGKVANEEAQQEGLDASPEIAYKKLEPPKGQPVATLPNPRQEPVSNIDYTPVRVTKVYIGRYATIEQAVNAQNNLVASSSSLTPFIKNMGDYYVLQVGSYSSPQKAQILVEQLIGQGYQARSVQE